MEDLRRRVHFVFFAGGFLGRFAFAPAENEYQSDEQYEDGTRYNQSDKRGRGHCRLFFDEIRADWGNDKKKF